MSICVSGDKMLIGMLVAFAFSWGPYLAHSFYVFKILGYNFPFFEHYRIHKVFTTLTFSAIAINPIVLPLKSK
jgi:hypothetical protein